MAEETKKEEGLGEKHPKKGGKLNKYKWWIVGGLAVIAILVFYFVNRSSQAGQGSAGSQAGGIDPNTGLPYASEYGMFGGGGMGVGPPGPRGGRGPRGRRGHRGPRGRRGHHDHTGGHHHRHHHHHRHGQHSNPLASTMRAGAETNAYSNSVLTHPGTYL